MPKFSITGEAEEALAAATAETVLLLAGHASVWARIREMSLAFDGTSATAAPVEIKVKRGNSASQGTSTAATEEKWLPDSPGALATGFHSFTAEPTYTGQPLMHQNIHPQGGLWVWKAIDDADSIWLDNDANSFIGIEVTAPAVVNVAAWLSWIE
jgi:hypothetical protein